MFKFPTSSRKSKKKNGACDDCETRVAETREKVESARIDRDSLQAEEADLFRQFAKPKKTNGEIIPA